MPPKKNRLTRKEFASVWQGGRWQNILGARAKFLPSPKETKLSIVVSKKSAKSAARRNKIRRTGYNFFRESGFFEKVKNISLILLADFPNENDKTIREKFLNISKEACKIFSKK